MLFYKQRENTAKYLYDISKGIALIALVSNIVAGKWDILNLAVGILATIGFFLWGYHIDGDVKDE